MERGRRAVGRSDKGELVRRGPRRGGMDVVDQADGRGDALCGELRWKGATMNEGVGMSSSRAHLMAISH